MFKIILKQNKNKNLNILYSYQIHNTCHTYLKQEL